MSDEYPKAQIDLSDPLNDSSVASLYFGQTGHGASDPAVIEAKAKVTAYFESIAGDTPADVFAPSHQESNLPMSTRGEFDRETPDLDDPGEQQPYNLVDDLSRDGYVGLGELATEMAPALTEALSLYGGDIQLLANAYGEESAGLAWAKLEKIARDQPDWASNKRLRATVVRLNKEVDSASIRIYNRL